MLGILRGWSMLMCMSHQVSSCSSAPPRLCPTLAMVCLQLQDPLSDSNDRDWDPSMPAGKPSRPSGSRNNGKRYVHVVDCMLDDKQVLLVQGYA